MNNIHKHLEFELSEAENNTINYLDLSIHRNTNSIHLWLYRKPTHTDITIQFSSKHPHEHKLAAFNFYVNRMLVLPITKQAKQQEWKIILTKPKTMDFHCISFTTWRKNWQPKNKNKTPNHNNTTSQKMGNIHVSESTNMKNN